MRTAARPRKRDDDYGGPAGQRLRFLGEVTRAVYAAEGDDIATWYSPGPEGYIDYPVHEA